MKKLHIKYKLLYGFINGKPTVQLPQMGGSNIVDKQTCSSSLCDEKQYTASKWSNFIEIVFSVPRSAHILGIRIN